ncbi:unnamed protein product [Amoebophrya sp. A120]|nr:unnamed protein product [Amoebophrya sp. A120]|eukprot:GSA120T00021157001.1
MSSSKSTSGKEQGGSGTSRHGKEQYQEDRRQTDELVVEKDIIPTSISVLATHDQSHKIDHPRNKNSVWFSKGGEGASKSKTSKNNSKSGDGYNKGGRAAERPDKNKKGSYNDCRQVEDCISNYAPAARSPRSSAQRSSVENTTSSQGKTSGREKQPISTCSGDYSYSNYNQNQRGMITTEKWEDTAVVYRNASSSNCARTTTSAGKGNKNDNEEREKKEADELSKGKQIAQGAIAADSSRIVDGGGLSGNHKVLPVPHRTETKQNQKVEYYYREADYEHDTKKTTSSSGEPRQTDGNKRDSYGGQAQGAWNKNYSSAAAAASTSASASSASAPTTDVEQKLHISIKKDQSQSQYDKRDSTSKKWENYNEYYNSSRDRRGRGEKYEDKNAWDNKDYDTHYNSRGQVEQQWNRKSDRSARAGGYYNNSTSISYRDSTATTPGKAKVERTSYYASENSSSSKKAKAKR